MIFEAFCTVKVNRDKHIASYKDKHHKNNSTTFLPLKEDAISTSDGPTGPIP